MKSTRSPYYGYRYPHEIIRQAVWIDYRFGIRFRDVEDRVAERGVVAGSSVRDVARGHRSLITWRPKVSVRPLDSELTEPTASRPIRT